MSEFDWDMFVVCPTCRHIERVDGEDEDAHKQPCPTPDCGWPLMLVRFEVWDEGDVEVTARWTQGEGARLFLDDAEKALARVEEEAEDDRIDDAMTAMRRERQEGRAT
jgi:hypothetical protein